MAKLVSIPPNVPFLDELCGRWAEQAGDDHEKMGEGVIIMPGRRAARALAEHFGQFMKGSSALLPRIMAVGDVENAELELLYPQDGSLWRRPRTITPMERLSALSSIILEHDVAGKEPGDEQSSDAPPVFGSHLTLAQAWPLAQELARLIDEAEHENVDLAVKLPELAQQISADMSRHWQEVLGFLEIITQKWPAYLEKMGVCNPVEKQKAILGRQVAIWAKRAREEGAFPVWAVGFTHGSRSTLEFLRSIYQLDGGKIVFPEIDNYLSDGDFNVLPDTHPQKGIADLLKVLGHTRGDVQIWGGSEETEASSFQQARWKELSQIMTPATLFRGWTRSNDLSCFENISRFEASDVQQEARGIAMIIRGALEDANKTIALVTPDRALAEQVSSALMRWGVVADDSAGIPLGGTVSAVLLRMIAGLVKKDFTPASWLAVFKHPFVRAGFSKEECRHRVRLVERKVLRGANPGGGFKGIETSYGLYCKDREAALADDHSEKGEKKRAEFLSVQEFMDNARRCLGPLCSLEGSQDIRNILMALIQVAQNLVCHVSPDGKRAGSGRKEELWSGETGRVLSYTLAELLSTLDNLQSSDLPLPKQNKEMLPAFLESVLSEKQVPLPNVGEDRAVHPRVHIWSCMSSRLQDVDVVILGGLSEGIWPAYDDGGPWMNRMMRKAIGLKASDYTIGERAYEFCSLCTRSGEVVLTSSKRHDDSVVVPSRWVQRMETYFKAQGGSIKQHPVSAWLREIDRPIKVQPQSPPAPRPELALRPRHLSVTEVEKFIRDPYSIYAKHVLGLRKLDTLLDEAGGREFGTIVHQAIEDWSNAWTGKMESASIEHLRKDFSQKAENCLREERVTEAEMKWWRPRIEALGAWFIDHQMQMDRQYQLNHFAFEVEGKVEWTRDGQNYRLRTRADYLAVDGNDNLYVVDYKTGQAPQKGQVMSGWNPQLPMEAYIALEGGFKDNVQASQIGNFFYMRLSGGTPSGKLDKIFDKQDEKERLESVCDLFTRFQDFWASFDQFEQAYYASPYPQKPLEYNDYKDLSRLEEWQFSPANEGEG